MAENEAARQTGEPIVVSDAPDVCLTPMGSSMVPVPYDIVAYFTSTVATTTTVVFTEDPVFTTESAIEGVLGDEAGSGMGLVSGSHAGASYCRVVEETHTMVVRTEGHLVVFHSSKMWMNCASPTGPGNTIGTVLWQSTSSDVSADEDGEVEGDTDPPAEAETEAELREQANAQSPESEGERWSLQDSEAGVSHTPTDRQRTFGGADEFNSTGVDADLNIGADRKLVDETWRHYGSDDNFARLGHVESSAGAGYRYDATNGTHSVGAQISGRATLAEGQLQGSLPTNLASGTAQGEVGTLSAQAGARAFAGPEGAGVEAKAGAEAVAARGSLGGRVNITPKTIYDSTAGALFGLFDRTSHLSEAPEYLDVGVTIGAEVELGIGAAASAEGEAKVTDQGAEASARVRVGAGPMAGAKVTGGIRLPEGTMDRVMGFFGW